MKKTIILIALIIIQSTFTFAQAVKNEAMSKANIVNGSRSNLPASDIKMRNDYGSENPDLMSVLRFEDIGMSKITFTGKDLIDKDFQITIKEFTNGKLAKQEVFFDSKEDEYFKIKSDKFTFKVLTKITANHIAKFDFQFNGFSKAHEYKIGKNFTGFAQKDFLVGKEFSIPLNENIYILTYMMPYEKKDGSKQYCEVAQSGINPEEFGVKYSIPTYFLIGIKFQ